MTNNYYPFFNLPLPYDYSALLPFIDEKTMELHHDRHLQTYINNLNAALADYPQLQELSLVQLIQNAYRLPEPLQTNIRNNAGGVYNHRFFFHGMIPPGSSDNLPQRNLAQEIDRQFGSFAAFRESFQKSALSVFGSGYAWLVVCRGQLMIITTANQNSPLAQNLCPILTIDVWEHAYYLKHYNLRTDYIDDWFHVINWQAAEKNYLACMHARA